MNKTRVGSNVERLAFALMLLGCSLAALADGYVTLTKGNSYKAGSGFAGAAWSETVEDPSTRDYLAAGGYTFYTMQNEVVNAHSLTLGIVGGTECKYFAYYSATFNNEGIVFANGEIYPRASPDMFGGKATFISPESAPYRFHGTNHRPVGFEFKDDVHCAAGNGILAYSQGTNGFHVTFSGDASDYLGSVVITSQYNKAGKAFGAEFKLSGTASSFGGSIIVRDGASFYPTITTSVKSLVLESGAALSLVAGNTLTVRTSLTVEGGPVPIALSGAPSAVVSDVTRHALITMPVASTCTEADFSLPNYGSSVYTKPKLVMRTSGDTKTLYAEYYPVVTLDKNNKGAIGGTTVESAVTNGTYWSDELPVHGLAHYQVNRINATMFLTTPYAPGEALVFPGESLRFGSYTAFQLRVGDYAVSNLMFNCGASATSVYGLDGEDITLRGSFSVSGQVDFAPRKSGIIRVVGPLTGTAGSLMNLCGAAAGTSQCRGIVVFDGDNTGYAGKFRVTLDLPANLTFGSQFMSLRTSSAASLGGPRTEFAYDALRLDTAGRLEAYDSFTLDEPTRGVFISGQGRFYVAAEKTMTLKEQLTVNGRAYKEGSGTLALGGALRYLDGTGAVTDVPPAHATNRTFYVTGGRVKPLTADALEGLYVVFSNKTSKLDVGLAMDVAPADATLLAKGICNTNSSAPFAWQSDEASPKITIRLDCADETPRQNYEFAVMTLSRDVADGVFDSVRFTLPDGFRHYGVTTTRTYDAEANTATLHATLEQRGIMLILR